MKLQSVDENNKERQHHFGLVILKDRIIFHLNDGTPIVEIIAQSGATKDFPDTNSWFMLFNILKSDGKIDINDKNIAYIYNQGVDYDG